MAHFDRVNTIELVASGEPIDRRLVDDLLDTLGTHAVDISNAAVTPENVSVGLVARRSSLMSGGGLL